MPEVNEAAAAREMGGPTPNRHGAFRLLQAGLLIRGVRAVRGVLLARLLAPDVFGSYAMIAAVIGPLMNLTNVGLTGVVAREAQPSPRLLATASWINHAIALVTGAILIGAVATWGVTGGHRELVGPGIAVAAASAAYVTPQVYFGLLQQRRQFRLLARLDIAFDIWWTTVAIALAAFTRSIWSLALAELSAQALRATFARRTAGAMPRAQYHREEIGHLLRFSAASMLGSLLWGLVFAIPVLLLQRQATMATVGLFSLAYTYSQLVALTLGSIGTRVLLPSLGATSSVQRLTLAWRYSEVLSLALAPLTGLFSVAAPPLLVALAGERWSGAALPLAVLAWGMAARVVFPINALAVAFGRPGLDNYLAGVSIGTLLATNVAFGWPSPTQAACFIVLADVVVILVAMVLSRWLWGAASGGHHTILTTWLAAVLARSAVCLIPASSNRWYDATVGGVVFLLIYCLVVLPSASLRNRYFAEGKHAIDFAKTRSLTL